nr:DUF2652 domain-containing protein [uncultured Allomuricauda sp.]
MEREPCLLCIPDISGFTQFMSEIDFELSSKIIPTLLNQIIYSNQIQLKVSEIEGDAILFYRSGSLPSLQELTEQCQNFHQQFYDQMVLLQEKYIDEGKNLDLPDILGLKIILHFGYEIAPVQIGNRIKLLGEDVILAHRLLKNNIPFDEYILFSEALISHYRGREINWHLNWAELMTSKTTMDHLGEVRYSYIKLHPKDSP